MLVKSAHKCPSEQKTKYRVTLFSKLELCLLRIGNSPGIYVGHEMSRYGKSSNHHNDSNLKTTATSNSKAKTEYGKNKEIEDKIKTKIQIGAACDYVL